MAEKTAKGYTPGEDGTPYQHTDKAKPSTGIHCQLLNPIEEDQVDRLIADPAWWMQEKLDGRRLLIRKMGDRSPASTVSASPSRCRRPCSMTPPSAPRTSSSMAKPSATPCMPSTLLLIGDDEIGGLRYTERYLRLMNLLASFQHRHIQLVETAFSTGAEG